MNDKTLNIKMPEKLYNDLKEEAKRKNVSLAALVRLILTEHFEK
jgi:predicted HicB family RNase H-like nuclease